MRLLAMVSIRAPARGATVPVWRVNVKHPGFDPRPRTGGDLAPACEGGCGVCFDPRPRTGGDLNRDDGAAEQSAVSIRAPARGATCAGVGARLDGLGFRSAPPHGGRRGAWAKQSSTGQFRSAPPHGGRRSGSRRTRTGRRFRSAPPHGGRRCGQAAIRNSGPVSIRAPARGATRTADAVKNFAPFRSAPPHGGRLLGLLG